jgi:hypothetical protein
LEEILRFLLTTCLLLFIATPHAKAQFIDPGECPAGAWCHPMPGDGSNPLGIQGQDPFTETADEIGQTLDNQDCSQIPDPRGSAACLIFDAIGDWLACSYGESTPQYQMLCPDSPSYPDPNPSDPDEPDTPDEPETPQPAPEEEEEQDARNSIQDKYASRFNPLSVKAFDRRHVIDKRFKPFAIKNNKGLQKMFMSFDKLKAGDVINVNKNGSYSVLRGKFAKKTIAKQFNRDQEYAIFIEHRAKSGKSLGTIVLNYTKEGVLVHALKDKRARRFN